MSGFIEERTEFLCEDCDAPLMMAVQRPADDAKNTLYVSADCPVCGFTYIERCQSLTVRAR